MAIYPWKFRSPLWPLQLMSQDSQLWPKLEFRLVRISVKHLEILGRKNWDISFEKIRLNLGNHHDQSWSNQQLVRSPGESGDGISHFLTMIWPPNKLKLNHSVQFFFLCVFPFQESFSLRFGTETKSRAQQLLSAFHFNPKPDNCKNNFHSSGDVPTLPRFNGPVFVKTICQLSHQHRL
jgi:hypothetical protein